MKHSRLPMGAALRVLALTFGLALSAQAAEEQAPRKDLALTGDAKCTKCHDETEQYPVLSIAKTKHGVVADKRTPTCTSCHGESETHTNKPEGVKIRPAPTFPLTKRSGVAPAEQNQQCLNCHKGGKFIRWAGSAHSGSSVSCTSCHQLHTGNDKVTLRASQPEVCMSCHKEKRTEITKPSRHPVLEGKVVCGDCHAAHGSIGPKLMLRDSVPDTCYTCHMEKRGPFVRNHQPVTEDCSICHNPHGSTITPLLKVRPPFLCQQCHEPNTHQGNIPGVTGGGNNSNASGIGIAQGRACLNCHTNIHGTNNPSSASNARTFRR